MLEPAIRTQENRPVVSAPEKPVNRLDDSDPLMAIERMLAAAAMAGICLISFGNVVVRYATNVSFAFTEEYSVFLLLLMTFVGGSAAFAANAHIRIGILADNKRHLRPAFLLLSALATLFVLGLLVFYGTRLTWDQYRFGDLSAGLGHPTWIYTVWMPALALLMIVRVLQRLRRDLKAL